MQLKESHLVKIPLPDKPDVSFNQRERIISTEVQKLIDAYNKQGRTVVDREIINKTSTHATVKFTTQKLIG
jgi:hypothetical protein